MSGTRTPHLTGTLRDLARISVGGDNSPSAKEGSLEYAAWLVFESLRERAERDDSELSEHDGFMGYTWVGYLKDVFHHLWPASSPLEAVTDLDEARSKVTTFLTSSGNLACIRRGVRDVSAGARVFTPSEWWVRAKFAEVHVSHVKEVKAAAKNVVAETPALEVKKTPDLPKVKAAPAIASDEADTFVDCREPGCFLRFPNANVRRTHELEEHTDMKSRKWKCFIQTDGKTCGNRFYDLLGLTVHMVRLHNVAKTERPYITAIDKSTAFAQGQGVELTPRQVSKLTREPLPADVVPVRDRIAASQASPPPPPPPPPAPKMVTKVTPPAPITSSVVTFRSALDLISQVVAENEQLHEKVVKLEKELADAKSNETLRVRLEELLKSTK